MTRQRQCLIALVVSVAVVSSLWLLHLDTNSIPLTFQRQHARLMTTLSKEFGHRYLLLAYMRSGSTFTSELLCLREEFNYIFEPLFIFRKSRIDWRDDEESLSVAKLMTEIYQCDPVMLSFVMNDPFVNRIRFNATTCASAPLLMKTIRLHGSTFRKMMETVPNLKVIHLVRDPRGIYLSRANVNTVQSESTTCQQIRRDLQVADTMIEQEPQRLGGRYMRVRYEDLVDHNTMYPRLKELYQFMGSNLTETQVDNYRRQHYTKQGRKTRFATIRDPSFDANKWRQELKPDEIARIEHVCADVMTRLGYETYSSGKNNTVSGLSATQPHKRE